MAKTVKCMNCTDYAYYGVDNKGANYQTFCKEHLPLFLLKFANPNDLHPMIKLLSTDVK